MRPSCRWHCSIRCGTRVIYRQPIFLPSPPVCLASSAVSSGHIGAGDCGGKNGCGHLAERRMGSALYSVGSTQGTKAEIGHSSISSTLAILSAILLLWLDKAPPLLLLRRSVKIDWLIMVKKGRADRRRRTTQPHRPPLRHARPIIHHILRRRNPIFPHPWHDRI